MSRQPLHPRLAADCHVLGDIDCGSLLLHQNATLPWFILVPATKLTELHELDLQLYQQVMMAIHTLAGFVKHQFEADKINIAAIGNQVPQLHIHVIGRRRDDPYWPGVVWGQSETSDVYSEIRLKAIRAALAGVFKLENR